ncbi:MAG: CoA transferase, partial [Acidimicrobiia bacterium]|nr:CoA transferase [Acidimicrobiia bacterium]
QHPELGAIHMMGVPVTVESAPGSVRGPAPLLGEHTGAVLAEWAAPSQEPQPIGTSSEPRHAERPLAGVRVIDLASFIAGPVVSRHLAMLGAEVIKVEAPNGDPFRSIGPPFESWNQGKKSVVLDLTTAAGQELLHRLAATADVVIENFRPGVAARLGADRNALRAVNPDLVILSSPGYGLDETMAGRPAFDPLVQALGGLMAAQGGVAVDPNGVPNGAEPVFLSVPIHDVATPTLGAFGLVMGLWQRARTGKCQDVRTSLVESTMAVQVAEYTRYEGRPEPQLGGFDHPGTSSNHGYETDDGWRWRDGDLDVDVCRTGLTGSELAAANGLLTTCEHPDHGPLVVFGQLIGGAGPPPTPAPALDSDGAEIRAELRAQPGGEPEPGGTRRQETP